jgi:hypothetical protein
MSREYFTQAEAEALMGMRIRTLVAWSGVPQDTTGEVVSADEGARGWTVAMQWDLSTEPLRIEVGQVEGATFVMVSGGKPLVDWFTKDEYERYLEELDDEKEA